MTVIISKIITIHNAYANIHHQRLVNRNLIYPICERGTKTWNVELCRDAYSLEKIDAYAYAMDVGFFPHKAHTVSKLIHEECPTTLHTRHILVFSIISISLLVVFIH
jgi:hypothetical protein